MPLTGRLVCSTPRFVLRFLLFAGLVLGSLVGPRASAQSVFGPPMSPPPATPRPFENEPSLRAVRADRHPPVRFSVAPKSERKDLRLYVERGMNAVLGPGGNRDTSELVPLCSPPCEMSLRARSYVLGVSAGERGAVKVHPMLQLRDGDQVSVHYNSRLPMRVVGWVLLLAGTTAGGALLAAGLPAQGDPSLAMVVSGSALLTVSLGVGLWFVNMPDAAKGWVTR